MIGGKRRVARRAAAAAEPLRRQRVARANDSGKNTVNPSTTGFDDAELAHLVGELVRRFAPIRLESDCENDTSRVQPPSSSSSSSSGTAMSCGSPEMTGAVSPRYVLRIAATATGFEVAWTDRGVDARQEFANADDLVQRVFVGAEMRRLLTTHHGCHALVARRHLITGAPSLPPPLVDICESYLTQDSRAAACYTLDVDAIAAEQWRRHKDALTWRPPRSPSSSGLWHCVAVNLWSDAPDGSASLPTAYAWRCFGSPKRDLRWAPSPIPAERATVGSDGDVSASRFDELAAAIETEIVTRRYGGTVQVPPGYGRIEIMVRCIDRSRARSIVVTHSRVSAGHLRDELRRIRPLLRVAVVRTAAECAAAERQKIAAESDVLIVPEPLVTLVPLETAARFERVYVDEYDLVQPATLVDWFRRWAPRAWVGVGVGRKRADGGHVVADLLFGESLFCAPV